MGFAEVRHVVLVAMPVFKAKVISNLVSKHYRRMAMVVALAKVILHRQGVTEMRLVGPAVVMRTLALMA